MKNIFLDSSEEFNFAKNENFSDYESNIKSDDESNIKSDDESNIKSEDSFLEDESLQLLKNESKRSNLIKEKEKIRQKFYSEKIEGFYINLNVKLVKTFLGFLYELDQNDDSGIRTSLCQRINDGSYQKRIFKVFEFSKISLKDILKIFEEEYND